MKCTVCGAESGKYPLCRACNLKKENGEIVKCEKCNCWHYKEQPCPQPNSSVNSNETYLYDLKNALITKNEQNFYNALKEAVPKGYLVFPQINLAAFIKRTDNELFRNIDFLITDNEYKPVIAVEINDETHKSSDRQERDKKVKMICEEAGIPLMTLWTSYGIKQEYLNKKVNELLENSPYPRKHNFDKEQPVSDVNGNKAPEKEKEKKQGCYIATCIYGSYDCPQVWVLRRYRDMVLARSRRGRAFIELYYSISPTLVSLFGKSKWFKKLFSVILNPMVRRLNKKGFENTAYTDA